MSRCPECGSKECCGADMAGAIDALEDEVKRLREAIAEQCCFDPMLCGRDGYICLACELSGEEDE